ncbi:MULTISPECIES: glycoside hydrolase family 25 protein [Chitinophagaceae]|uniref:glycoside hydrolase family 25 protein n=1 Tax=Chitinophagaceae TaxID=563835 RepID=UPI000DEFFC08|nr:MULTISPECIES: glycoside hydrolase family 25 protein [Chitinophagaceae]RPD50832.1 glycoside hydrolase family 25 protein [Paracnuella aquatica]
MPPKKRKNNRLVPIFALLMALAALGFLAWVFWQWRSTRDIQFVRYPEFGIALPARYSIHGIDVSRYQERINWTAVRDMQVQDVKLSFAIIKATEGTSRVDPQFKRNWRKSKEAGITRGAYHFFIATRDGKKQAENFLKQVKFTTGDLPPVLDVETTNGVVAFELRKQVAAWLDAVEGATGVKPIIYTNVDFYKNYLQGFFDAYPLWVAHYLEAHQPRISRSWVMWQHSEKGRVNGIRSRVDFNVFNGDSVAFRSLLIP